METSTNFSDAGNKVVFSTTLFVLVCFASLVSDAQSFTGPEEVCQNSEQSYSYWDDVAYTNVYWSVDGGGTIVSGSGLSRIISWSSSGSVTVSLYNSKGMLVSSGTKYVNIAGPGTLNIPSQSCPGQPITLSLSGYTGSSFNWESSADGYQWNLIGTFGPSITQYPNATTYYRAYNPACGWKYGGSTSGMVTVNPQPITYSMIGGGGYCTGGSGASVGLNGSQGGVHYQLRFNGSNYGAAVGGTGGALYWNNLTSAGSYTVVATSGICGSSMSGAASVFINSLPGQYNVFGGGSHCDGGSSSVYLTYSQTSVEYQLYLNGSPYGNAKTGTFSQLSWSGLTQAGNYTVIGTNPSTGCNIGMNGSATISAYPLPGIYAVEGGGAYCAGGSGVTVSLNGSQSGVNYYLKINGGYAEGVTPGTGGSLSWPNQTILGTYTVEAVGPGLCYQQMSGSVGVSTNPIPDLPTGTGGNVCGSGSVSLSASYGANANDVRWYSSSGTYLASGSNYSTPTLSSSVNYHITSYNATTGCESPVRVITATVNPIPGLPNTVNGSTCGTGSVSLSATAGTAGNQVRWYSAPSEGTLLATSANYNTPALSSTTDYYVSSYNSATTCESSRTATTATINAIPTAPTISGNERFGSGTFALLVSGGSSYEWYNPNNILLSTNAEYTTPVVSESTSNYAYVKSIENGCYSQPIWVNLTVYTNIFIAGTGNAIALAKDVVLDAGAGYQSYDWRNGGASLSSERYYTTNLPGNYTVTVTKGTAIGTSAPFILTEQFENLNYNYVATNVIQVPITNADEIKNLPIEANAQSIQYVDGLGRPWQSVVTQGSPSKKDIVQHVEYDKYGRESFKYAPFVSESYDGILILNPTGTSGNYSASIHHGFYNNGNGDKITDDARPFSETIFEASPLNRPIEEFGTGADWHANNKSIKLDYLSNVHGTGTGQEQIIAWKVDAANGLPVRITQNNSYTSGGYFTSGQLNVKSTKDEQGNEVREYTNKSGQVILKKIQYVESAVLSNRDHWAQTYYVYDDFGLLHYVFQPELSKTLHASGTTNPNVTQLNNFAFQYKYDYRKRMVEKRVPGSGWVYMVYDSRDRLVLTQDAVQRSTGTKYWSFTKYDLLNRPILTGIKDTTAALSQAQMQTVVNTHYQKSWAEWGESYIGATTGNVHGYTNLSYPISTKGNAVDIQSYLTVAYYDNYDFQETYYDNSVYAFKVDELPGEQEAAPFMRVKNQVTGSKIKVLDGGITGGYTWLKSVNYYDDHYRVVQSVMDNYKGGVDRVTNVYDFVGKVLKTKSTTTTYDVTWVDKVNVIETGNKLVNTASGWGSAGAASLQILPAGQDGWMEVVVSETNKYRMIGLSDINTNAHYNTLDYTFYILTNSTIRIYESGSSKGSFGSVASGDVLRIERNGSTITYLKNGVLKYTSTKASTTQLMADCAFYTNNGSLVNVRTSFSNTTQSETRRFNYDHAGRLLKTYHSLNGSPEVILASSEYNELGQLVDKKLHSEDGGSQFRQSMDYRYNVRGWLTSINNAQLTIDQSNDDEDDYFGMELAYNNSLGTGNAPLFNGNISAMTWSVNQGLGDVKRHAYNYNYDPLNRIKGSDFQKHNGIWTSSNAFDVNGFDYDQNGNIKGLTRNDQNGSPMDQLSYDYGAGNQQSNQLRWVTDTGDIAQGFVDGNTSGDDYLYDANGNMKEDKNKGITTITYNHLNLPEKVTKGTGEYIQYIYNAGGSKLAQFVYESNNALKKSTDYLGAYVFENDTLKFLNTEEGRIVMTGDNAAIPEYQYHLKDHLGNVRLTFTTKDEEESNTATLEIENETEERSEFLYYDDTRKINASLFDHTGLAATQYALRLNGTANEKTGLAKSLAVVPGDKIQLEVYAKYVDPNSSNWTTALTNLLSAIAQGTAPTGTVIDGAGYSTGGSNSFAFGGLLDKTGETGVGPKAFLNYLVFDKDFNPVLAKSGYKRLSDAPRETGNDVTHEKLDWEIDITQPGFVYIWLSNEEVELGGSPVEVYFDDFSVTHVKSPVIQSDEYYPFGLTFNSYQRESSTINQYLYNGKEIQDELGLDWLDYGARMYMPEIGRWGVVDPLADNGGQESWSPYVFSFNNPLRFVDPDGLMASDTTGTRSQVSPSEITATAESTVQQIKDDDPKGSQPAKCSTGVRGAFKELTGSDELDDLLANDIIDHLSSESQKKNGDFVEVEIDKVQEIANNGGIVIGGKKASDSGHVVLAVPGEESYSGNFKSNVPKVMDTGVNKRRASSSVGNSWTAGDASKVKFYQYVGGVTNGPQLKPISVTATRVESNTRPLRQIAPPLVIKTSLNNR